MSELVEKLAEQYGWSPSVPNLSDKLRRESLRFKEAVELESAPSEPGGPFTMPRSREHTSDFSIQRDVMGNGEIPAEGSVLYSLSSVACFHDKLLR